LVNTHTKRGIYSRHALKCRNNNPFLSSFGFMLDLRYHYGERDTSFLSKEIISKNQHCPTLHFGFYTGG